MREIIKRSQASASATQFFSIGITASSKDTHPPVKQIVVCLVLADNKWGRVRHRSVSMMNYCFRRERMTECLFRTEFMNLDPSPILINHDSIGDIGEAWEMSATLGMSYNETEGIAFS
jgi:hypothetical protein